MTYKAFRKSVRATLVASLLTGLIMTPLSASAYETDGLMFFYDFRTLSNTNTTLANGTSLNDLSGNNRNGSVVSVNGLNFNATTQALEFPGGNNGTAYVNLSGDFSNFSSGITIEFEGEFGSTRSAWERIFDFGNTDGSGLNNNFWVGHMDTSNELALETWHNGVNQGRCHTDTGGTALGANGTRTFAKWVLTVGDENGVTKCRIYKDGVELRTGLRDGNYQIVSSNNLGGTTYSLPLVKTRNNNYLGRSNWAADRDLEGSIRYLRLYNQVLSPEEVLNNATNSSIPTVNNTQTETPTLAKTGVNSGVIAMGLIALAGGLFLTLRRKIG